MAMGQDRNRLEDIVQEGRIIKGNLPTG